MFSEANRAITVIKASKSVSNKNKCTSSTHALRSGMPLVNTEYIDPNLSDALRQTWKVVLQGCGYSVQPFHPTVGDRASFEFSLLPVKYFTPIASISSYLTSVFSIFEPLASYSCSNVSTGCSAICSSAACGDLV